MLVFNYWLTIIQLLKTGFSWEAISDFTDEELHMIMGTEMAISQKQNEAEVSASARNFKGPKGGF